MLSILRGGGAPIFKLAFFVDRVDGIYALLVQANYMWLFILFIYFENAIRISHCEQAHYCFALWICKLIIIKKWRAPA